MGCRYRPTISACKHEPAARQPLQQVRADIEKALRDKAAHSTAMAAAVEAKNKIIAGATPDSVLAENQTLESAVTLTRQGNPEWVKIEGGF